MGGRPTAEDLPGEGYRLAVAVGNPENAEQLVRTAADIAGDRGGELLVVSTIVTERASPASLYADEVVKREFAGDRAAILDRATETAAAADADVPVAGQLLVARDVADALVSGVREFDCDGLLLGWQDRRRRDTILGSNVDSVLERTPADVFVERIETPVVDVDRVLLPVARSPHLELAATVARAIARANDATVDVVHVLDPDASAEERADAETLLADAAGELGPVAVETALVTGGDVADAIVDATTDRDVVVLGATRQSDIQRRLVGSVAQAVGRRADSIAILARSPQGRPPTRRWMRRLVPFV